MARLSAASASSAWLMARLASPIARVGAAASFAAAACAVAASWFGGASSADEPRRVRFGGRERLAAEDQARGAMTAEGSHQGPRRTGIRDEPNPDEGLDEAGIVGGMDQVAGERQRDTGAGGHAVHGGDDRLGQIPDGGDERVVLIGQDAAEVPLAAPAAQVGTAAEAAPLAGDDHRSDRFVPRGRLERSEQLAAHLRVQGIERLRAVEGDGRDRIGQIDPDRLIRRLAHVAHSTGGGTAARQSPVAG